MTSMSYWNIASNVRDELRLIAAEGDEMYAALEANDDPGETADFLMGIQTRLIKMTTQIAPNVPALRKVSKALTDLPGVKP